MKCFLCGGNNQLDNHHIFGGPNRKLSTKYGLTVKLCHVECHQCGKNAVHINADVMQKLHEYGQRKFMQEQNASIAEFVKIFKKNYLDEEW